MDSAQLALVLGKMATVKLRIFDLAAAARDNGITEKDMQEWDNAQREARNYMMDTRTMAKALEKTLKGQDPPG